MRACHAVLDARLPEGQVLSHDLLEGSIARCAGISDITLVEDSPMHADVAHARLHRWTRGDWQLLPFIARAGRYGIAPINRWKLIDNLRRSLVAPMSLGLMLLVLGTEVLPFWLTLAVVAGAFAVGPLVGALAGLVPSRDGLARRYFYRETALDLRRALGLAAWHVALLLHLSLLYLDAIGRALWRQTVSGRRLLEWTTAAAAQAAARREPAGPGPSASARAHRGRGARRRAGRRRPVRRAGRGHGGGRAADRLGALAAVDLVGQRRGRRC